MKVYVVGAGKYEDYMPCAVFSTRELAQKYVDNGHQDEYYDITEFEVDHEA